MRTLPPWDANAYFDTPVVNNIPAGVANSVMLCKSNPNRVGLIISCAFGSQNVAYVGPGTNIAPGTGIQLVNTYGWLEVTHEQWGALVGQEWNGVAQGTGASFSVIELVLSRYPIDDPADTADTRDWLHRLTAQIKALVGKKNGNANRPVPNTEQGASQPDYWRRYLGASAIRTGNGKGNTG